MDDLASLRHRIASVDEELLRLVAERMELARAAGRAKQAEGVPLRDFEVERRVLERASLTAAELGLAAEPVRRLMQLLIGASRDEQERLAYGSYEGEAEEITVVGGRGKMGGWLVDFLRNQGHGVRIAEREDDLGVVVRGSALAFIATPQEVVAPVLEHLTALAYPGIVCDVASTKAHLGPAVATAAAAGIAVTSIHPMFGPATRTLSDQVICICDCGNAAATERVVRLFSATAATLVPLDFDQHDRIVSYVLGLSHLLNLLFAGVLAKSPLPIGELDRIGSTTFHAQMETARTVVGEDSQLYFTIQRLNRFSPGLYEEVRSALEEVTGAVERGDRDAFRTLMERSRRWLEEEDPR